MDGKASFPKTKEIDAIESLHQPTPAKRVSRQRQDVTEPGVPETIWPDEYLLFRNRDSCVRYPSRAAPRHPPLRITDLEKQGALRRTS